MTFQSNQVTAITKTILKDFIQTIEILYLFYPGAAGFTDLIYIQLFYFSSYIMFVLKFFLFHY